MLTNRASPSQLLHTLDELLMVNLDVFTHVITWFITLTADHEDVKRQLRDEVAANKDNLLEYITKTDTHLHRCFYESMRVRPFTSKSFYLVSPSVSIAPRQSRELHMIRKS